MGRQSKRRKIAPEVPTFPLRRSARLSAENRRPATLNPVSEAQGSGQGAETSSDTQLIADEHCPFDMELAVRPPPRVAAGLTLDAPLVVTFSTASYGQRNVAGLQDLSGVWAYLSLVTADRKQSLAPPQKDLLLGHIADSIHPLETVNNRQPFAYATFSGVAIMRPGRYCFKVNIIDMSQPHRHDARGTNVQVLRALHSDVFDVVQSERHSSLSIEIRETIRQLRAVGANLKCSEWLEQAHWT